MRKTARGTPENKAADRIAAIDTIEEETDVARAPHKLALEWRNLYEALINALKEFIKRSFARVNLEVVERCFKRVFDEMRAYAGFSCFNIFTLLPLLILLIAIRA